MRPTLLPSLLLVLLTALAFWPVRTATFLRYDDPLHVTHNPYILPPSPARFAYFWRYPFDRTPVPGVASTAGQQTPPYEGIYSPLAFTVWGLLVYPARIAPMQNSQDVLNQNTQQEQYPLDPSIYHSFNLGLHVLNVLLVFALLRQFVKNEWAAALGTALFAVHPVQVEPVAWVTGMNNLLSGFFALLALLLYLKNKDEGDDKKEGLGPRWRIGTYWGSVLCFLLSVLSKPSSITLPLLALLLCFGLGEKRWRARLLEMIPWGAVALFCFIANQLVQQGKDYGLPSTSWQRPFLVGDALTFYASKLLFPFNLAPDYGRRPEWVMQQPLTYVLWLIPIVVSAFVWLWWKRSAKLGQENYIPRIALVCLAIFVTVLLPSSGIITYYFHLISIVSDRYMYMALLGPALLVAVLAARWFAIIYWGRLFPALGLIALLTFLSFRQAQLWQSDSSLWAHNIALNPRSTVAYFPYAMSLYTKGDYPKALLVLQKAAEVDPKNWLIELGLGNTYFRLNRYAEAEPHFRRALKILPASVNAHLSLGVLLSQVGRMGEAAEQFAEGLQLQPDNTSLLVNMGLSLTKLGKGADGARYIQQALDHGFDPAKGRLYLGNALAREGKIKEAMNEWYAAVQLDPNNYEGFFNLGNTVARLGNTTLAIQLFENAARVKPDYAPTQVQLGLLWQKQGQIEKARTAFSNALKIDPQNALAMKSLKNMK